MEGRQQLTGQATVERLSRRSTLIFVLLALVAVFTYFLVAGETADERASAAEINLAGKRRMLSQRIGLLTSQFLHEQKAEDFAELGKALKLLAVIHETLTHGDPEHGIRAPRTEKLRASYAGPEGVDEAMRRYLVVGNTLLQTAETGGDYRASAGQLISISQGEFLDALDQLVDQYQVESEQSTDTLRLLQWCALLAALGLLAFSALGVLRPLIAQVRRSLEEQATSEKALRQAVEKNHLILQATGEGIFGVDRSGRISFANPAAAALLGTESEHLVGCANHHDIMSTAAGCPICRVLNNGGEVQRSDGRFRRRGTTAGAADDDCFPVEYSVAPRPDGEGAVISFRDISERWQAELKLQRFQQRMVDAIEALDDAFALFDNEDRLSLYNLRFTETFPLRGEIISIGMPFNKFVRAVAEQHFYAIPIERTEDWVAERMAVHRRAEGSTEIPLAAGRWLRATERRTREGGTVVIWSDVSHLKQALIAADQASRAKSEFMARMSHELRTPLNAILGFAQVLEQGLEAPLTTRQMECITHILQGGRHLLALINEVLDLSAIEAGRLDIEIEGLALAPLLRECQALVSPQAVNRQVALSSGDAGQCCVRADRKRLKQILLNLLSNGIKYNREGGQLTLSIIEEETIVRLTVADTGHGIPPDLARRVFQPFDRLGASNVEGTGIGLSITRRLVELMGGHIGFDSVVGVGTTFWVELDKAPGEYADSLEEATYFPTPTTTAQTFGAPLPPAAERGILALGLDPADHELLRLVVSTLRNTRLASAASPDEMHRLIAGQPYQIVIADGTLLDDFLAEMPQHGASPPLLIALGEPPNPRLTADPGISHWQPKPLKARELARILRKAMP